MKGEIPGRIPGIFPFVWHGDHITVVHVMPVLISETLCFIGPQWINAKLLEPGRDVVVVELFGPQHPCHRLPEHQLLLSAESSWHHPGVVVIAVLFSAIQDLIKVIIGRVVLCFRCRLGQSQLDRVRGVGANREVVNCGCFCALLGWVDSCRLAMN